MGTSIKKKVNILGIPYTIIVTRPEKDKDLLNRHSSAYGYTDTLYKKIVLADRSRPDMTDNELYGLIEWMKKTLRHEIIHAMLLESGLAHNARCASAWPDNEEMVDWFALQGPKIIKAWKESGAYEEE